MLRIHFTAEDLARVRMAAGLGLIAETVFALDTFASRGGGGLRQWHKQVRGELGGRLPAIEQLLAGDPPVPSLQWLLMPVTGSTADGTETGKVRTVVSSFSRVAVEPYWKQISSQLEREREFRARVTITKGFDGLLSTLHSAVSWKFPVLEIPSATTGDVYLSGRGVLLAPSLFLMRKHCAIINVEKNSGIPAIVFPAAQATDLVLPDNGGTVGGNCALGSLLGHSRAAALEVLLEGRTTGELSRQLGLSLAGASKHAAVLRQAGLVTTFRHRNTALHFATPLGQALLRGAETENSWYPLTHDSRERSSVK